MDKQEYLEKMQNIQDSIIDYIDENDSQKCKKSLRLLRRLILETLIIF